MNLQKHLRIYRQLLNNNQGLTLTEILISLTIIGFIATFIGSRVFVQLQEGRVESAKIQMQNLASLLKEYRRHCGNYPTTEQGLSALVEKPTNGPECKRYAPGGYIGDEGKVPMDPWGHDYGYTSDGRTFNIVSYGADGVEGGEGDDADIWLYDNAKSSAGGAKGNAPAANNVGDEKAPQE